MALEPPVKKRRRHEFCTLDGIAAPAASEGLNMSPDACQEEAEPLRQGVEHFEASDTPEAGLAQPSHLSTDDHSLELHEENLQKKRNYEEVSGVWKTYRRLKRCVSGEHDSPEEAEEAFRALLGLVSGCTSVRRIAAELIPRYATFSPRSLEAALRALLQLCDWSSDLILRGDDSDALTEETARIAYSGIVDLSAAAVSGSAQSSDLSVQGAAVCRDIALYLLHRLHGGELVDLDDVTDGKVREGSPSKSHVSGSTAIERLEKMVISSTVKVFRIDPEGMLLACFDLLGSAEPDYRKQGQHFIKEILTSRTLVTPADRVKDEALLSPKEAEKETSTSSSTMDGTSGWAATPQKAPEENANDVSNLVMQVIHPRPLLERWIVAAVRHFRKSASHQALSETLVLLDDFVKSLLSFKPSDLELHEEPEASRAVDDERVNGYDSNQHPSKVDDVVMTDNLCGDTCRGTEGQDNGYTFETKEGSATGRREGMAGSSSKYTGDDQVARRGYSRAEMHRDSDEVAPRRERVSGNGVSRPDRSIATGRRDFGREAGSQSRRYGDEQETEKPVHSARETWDRARATDNGLSRRDLGGAVTGLSPQQPTTPQPASSPSRQFVWYPDGDPAAMEVYVASQHLWVGSLDQMATESTLRSEFDHFGQLESVSILHSQGFALIDYKSVKDAVKARESLQGKLHCGKALQIKFLDGGMSRGTGGATVGSSCHVWVGGITSQSAKDELLNDLANAGLKGPLSVFALVSASAILLEFETPEDAAAVVQHVRQKRKEGGFSMQPPKVLERSTSSRAGVGEFGNRHLWVGRIDPMAREEDLIGAFSQYGELTGWKVLRASSCCFIDFRSPEAAAVAKSHLNGARFGCQCIQVEFKNNPTRNHPGPPLSSPPGGRLPGGQALATALANLSNKFHSSGGGGTPPGRGRALRMPGRETNERVPTNTLWIGLPDSVSPSFMNESELKSLFNMAASGVGVVTKVRSARTSRGPCRFVEFDRVEAAAVSLRSVSGRLDASIQIEFSNSAISMQQSENPQFQGYQNSYAPVDETRRRAFDHHRDRERSSTRASREWEHEREDMRTPTPGASDEAGSPSSRSQPSLPPGWGGVSEKDFSEEGYRREHKKSREDGPLDPREDFARVDPSLTKMGSTVSRSTSEHGEMRNYDASPSMSHGSVVHSRKPLPERQQSGGNGTRPPLPPPGRVQLEKEGTYGGSNAGGRALSPMGFKQDRYHGRNAASPSRSVVISAGSKFSGQSNPPLPPVPPASPPPPPPPSETPPRRPPFSPQPTSSARNSSYPPASWSPPPRRPPPRESAPEASGRWSSYEPRGSRGAHHWVGPLCKSGMRYCEIVAHRLDSPLCEYENGLREPTGWPVKLDVTKRADFKSVQNSFNSTPSQQREVCRLSVSPEAESRDGFEQFVTYLKQRDRAGVVKISAGSSIWSRMLYILPWSQEICSLLAISSQPRDCLIGLLLPSPANMQV